MKMLCLLWCCTLLGCAVVAHNQTRVATESAIAIDIEDSVLIDGELHVRAGLRALTSVPTNALSVTLRGLHEGELVRESTVEASSLHHAAILAKGEGITAQFAIDATDITEFQVAGEWGGAQEPSVHSDKPVIISESALSSDPIYCHAPPCDMLYTVSGVLRNTTDSSVGGIVLGLHFDWVERGKRAGALSSGDPAQQIALGTIVIPPGGEKKFQLTFDRRVPELSSGRFIPRVSVLQVELIP